MSDDNNDRPLFSKMAKNARVLSDDHRRFLHARAVSDAIIAERGYYTVTEEKEIKALGFSKDFHRVPALIIPVFDALGAEKKPQIRPNHPAKNEKGKKQKYGRPTGAPNVFDVHPRVRPALKNPAKPLIITEGIPKADAAVSAGIDAISIQGVHCWKTKNERGGGPVVIPDFENIVWGGRETLICFDSDVMTNDKVRGALIGLADQLELRDAIVKAIILPSIGGQDGTGLDDYLAASPDHDEASLIALARPFKEVLGTLRPRLELVKWQDVEPEEIEFLWEPYVIKGKMTMFEGDPEAGKTFFSLQVAAAVTNPSVTLPCGNDRHAPLRCAPADVLYIAIEDDVSDTLLPRFTAMGGDTSRIYSITGVRNQDEIVPWDLDDIESFRETIAEVKPALVVFDPLLGFMGESDSHKDAAVRAVLNRVKEIAHEHRCAVLSIRHFKKDKAGNAKADGMGSIAFVAHARSQIAAVPHPTDPSQFVMAHTKANLSPRGANLAYGIRSDPQDPRRAIFEWQGEFDCPHEVLFDQKREKVSKEDEALEFWRDWLADGPRPVKEVEDEAKTRRISIGTLQRARGPAGVRSFRKDGDKRGWVRLTPPDDLEESAEAARKIKY